MPVTGKRGLRNRPGVFCYATTIMTASSTIRSLRAVMSCASLGLAFNLVAQQPVEAQSLPSYAVSQETIHGRIAGLDGADRLTVRDDRGFVDNVSLHPGTIINPTGLRLAAGQSVTILGHTKGKTFEAYEIDTPYTSYSAAPVVPYPYAYPAYGYYTPYAYGPYGGYGPYAYPYPRYGAYGPRFDFGFGFRNRGFAFGGRF